ncbi:glycosyltransferase family 2 protein [Helicobacter fennelliae]|uniref:Glycosyl transferase n=1 Tax=Helicobacter fennelliae MRY12-0050 TaxID=1325130 RepID=T1DV03_9HELI|nr:glycosyltransferase family 2 protein [Helicobacter fennelliae]GAD18333.1 glycosyl transferase [Helicobacter fennelliae MRY12-0050]STP06889.1 Bactoprenol glucosyl transferase homolog from prophage CPS-53 [Helicobacter fennelliae]
MNKQESHHQSCVGISIVVPCYNEEISLPKFMQEITKTMESIKPLLRDNTQLIAPQDTHFQPYEFIFVNDGSKDKTLQILMDMNAKDTNPDYTIRVFSFSRNFGKEAAILAGLQQARGEGVILLDADLQDPPSLIPQMVEIWLKSKRQTKIIYARRTTRAGESKIRAFLSELFYKVSNWISEVKIESGVRDFRLMDREVVNALLKMPEYHRFSKAMFAWVGFKRQCLEYEYIPHFKESSSWSFWKLFKYAIEGIVSFSTMPLRIAFVFGFFISLFAVVYGIYRIVDTILYGNPVPGYPSLIVIISFIGGIQLILLGIIGEYIARIYEQVKMRPHFILDTLERKDCQNTESTQTAKSLRTAKSANIAESKTTESKKTTKSKKNKES